MIWLFIILELLTALTVFVLVTPFIIRIDTTEPEYSIRWKGIAGVRLVPDAEELVIIRYRIFFLKAAIIH